MAEFIFIASLTMIGCHIVFTATSVLYMYAALRPGFTVSMTIKRSPAVRDKCINKGHDKLR